MKILCIGHSSWDITVPADVYPVENTKYRFNEKYSCGGGPAGNAAYLLGKWGIDTVIASNVGSDDFGANFKVLELIPNIWKLVMIKIRHYHLF